MTSSHQLNRSLTAALQKSAKRAGEQAPSVRGGDWRLATVTAVNGDGTVEVDDVMDVRRMAFYTSPTVGQVIRIDQSSSGNWVALGPLAT
ncbi:hypothetical protein OHV08_34295 [Streptomyces canus]|uniref:hypothetical protein n=1 Tax=Streptomyces canus TaxID=58343 RepID=UPI003254F7DD